MRKQENSFGILEIIFIVLIILIFIGSFGQVDITLEKGTKESDEAQNNLSKLQARHKKLKALIEKKEQLNIKLNTKFKRIYFGVRFVLASLYIGYNALLYFVFNITNLGDLLNWNEFAVIVIALFSFIAFGTFAHVKDFIQNIKIRLESRTYNKYVNITEQLESHKLEVNKLTATITKTQFEPKSQEIIEATKVTANNGHSIPPTAD
jgi:hypothetical protein